MKLLLLCVLSLAACSSNSESKKQAAQIPPEPIAAEPVAPIEEPEKAAEVREGTLKVLPASWSKDELKSYMNLVSKGLGVTCDHCHDLENMASDAMPTKLSARKMMSMVNDLNQVGFNGEEKVSCITCHKGQEKPAIE